MKSDRKNRSIMIRVTDAQANELNQLAKKSNQSITSIIREMIDFGLKNIHKPRASRLERTLLLGMYESVFMLRGLAERVDEAIAVDATKDARRAIERQFEEA